MMPLTLSELADVVAGDLLHDADADRRVHEVTIDSRTAAPEALFIPLRGERTDGHRFIHDAVARGAAYLVAADAVHEALPGGVVVDDPADALLGLGFWHRDTVDPAVVAVTGSVGKTTTKDFIAAAVGGHRRTVASPASFNNEVGVPLTCCRLVADSEVLVAEIGARGIGHVASLAGPLAPDVAVVTAVAAAHLAMLGTIENVARAKGELVDALAPGGVAILNGDDPRVAAMASRAPGDVVTYGVGPDVAWRAEDVELDAHARATFRLRGVRVRLPLPGEHLVGNALAALAVADALGVDLAAAAAGLAEAPVSRWRMEVSTTPDGVTVVNDAYNANPASMEAALKTLAAMTCDGRRWAVLGQMAELGPDADLAHDRIGRLCIRLGIDGLVVVGEEAGAIRNAADLEGFYGQGDLYLVAGPDEAVDVLRGRLAPGDVVLVKASRAAGLERVVTALGERP